MFESNPDTQNPFGECPGIDLVQFEDSIFNGKRVMEIVALTLQNLENYQALWKSLIRLGRDHFGMSLTVSV